MALVDVVKWDNPGTRVVWKFPRNDLSTMTQLIVNESQSALLFKNGQACDVFRAGRHTLSTQNIPILNKLVNLPFGGQSPFAAEVWFVNQTISLNLKFGTATPLQLEDPSYGVIVPVRAYGQFGLQIEDPAIFVRKLVGTNAAMGQSELAEFFQGILVSRLKSRIAKVILREKIGVLEVEMFLDELSRSVEEAFAPDYAEYGLAMRAFRIMSISVPENDPSVVELKKAKAAGARRRIEGTTYAQERGFDALQAAAGNEGAGGAFASVGAGLAMGHAIGSLGQQLIGGLAGASSAPPSPFSGSASAGTPPTAWHIVLNGQQMGPFGVEVLRQGVATGQFTRQTPVWRKGMADWSTAGEAPELSDLFSPSSDGPPPFSNGDAEGGPPPFGSKS